MRNNELLENAKSLQLLGEFLKSQEKENSI